MVSLTAKAPKQSFKPPINYGPKRKPGGRAALAQCLDMQECVYSTALLLKDDCVESTEREERARCASALASLCKAWEAMDDRRRILRGKPLPGSLRPERKPVKKRVVSHAPTEEPLEPPAPTEPKA